MGLTLYRRPRSHAVGFLHPLDGDTTPVLHERGVGAIACVAFVQAVLLASLAEGSGEGFRDAETQVSYLYPPRGMQRKAHICSVSTSFATWPYQVSLPCAKTLLGITKLTHTLVSSSREESSTSKVS